MRVFISSVTARLKDERHDLAALLAVMESYEPVQFEDFGAQDRSSRDACLGGVRSSDVYVLLLGPVYGQRWVDSNLAATEEEFALARKLGKPILAFVKATDEADEPDQAAFKRHVEGYVGGRFRASFTDSQSLNLAVVAALRGLHTDSDAVQWERLDPPATVQWRWETPLLSSETNFASALCVNLG